MTVTRMCLLRGTEYKRSVHEILAELCNNIINKHSGGKYHLGFMICNKLIIFHIIFLCCIYAYIHYPNLQERKL